MPPRISGHDLMAIFPTNPPSHNVSCDDLFKKQARQFLSTPDPQLAAKREPNMAPAGAPHDGHHGAYDAAGGRAPTDPAHRAHPQFAPPPAMGHGHSSPDSRPQTRNRPPTRMEGASPVIYQFEVRAALPRVGTGERSLIAPPVTLFVSAPLLLPRRGKTSRPRGARPRKNGPRAQTLRPRCRCSPASL